MKHLIDLDETVLEEARSELGTTTLKDTVNAALREVISTRAAIRHLEWLAKGDHDLGDPEIMAQAWR